MRRRLSDYRSPDGKWVLRWGELYPLIDDLPCTDPRGQILVLIADGDYEGLRKVLGLEDAKVPACLGKWSDWCDAPAKPGGIWGCDYADKCEAIWLVDQVPIEFAPFEEACNVPNL